MTKVNQLFTNPKFVFLHFPFPGFSNWKRNAETEAASEGRERERKEDLCQNVCVTETAVTSLHTDLPALVS